MSLISYKLMQATFLDIDSLINYDYAYVYKFKDFKFCKGIIEALKNLLELNYNLTLITNQSINTRGIFTKKEYEKTADFMIDKFKENDIKITKIYDCPPHPIIFNKEFFDCECRKPKPEFIIKASSEYNIEMHKSISNRDSERDLIVAKSTGIRKRYLLKQYSLFWKKNLVTSLHNSLFECEKLLKNNSK